MFQASIRKLSFAKISELSDESVVRVVKQLTTLNALSLAKCIKISNNSILEVWKEVLLEKPKSVRWVDQ
jgi:hypothetical protein